MGWYFDVFLFMFAVDGFGLLVCLFWVRLGGCSIAFVVDVMFNVIGILFRCLFYYFGFLLAVRWFGDLVFVLWFRLWLWFCLRLVTSCADLGFLLLSVCWFSFGSVGLNFGSFEVWLIYVYCAPLFCDWLLL